MRLKKIKQRGQVMTLYGLLVPFLFLVVGVGLDLGWYYLNVSRLQNAADAAALAGAQALVKEDAAFDNYYVVQLASNQLPSDFDTYAKVFKNTFESGVDGLLLNYWTEDEAKETLLAGRTLAEQYARLNLDDTTAVSDSTDWTTLSATDAWNKSVKEEDRKVSGTIDLKYQIVDAKNDKYGPLYYVVSLEEKVRHFLLPGWFEAMDAPVRAVVLLQPHHKGLIEPMDYFEKHNVIDNWEYTNKFKGTTGFFSGKWNHYQAGVRNNNNYGIRYTSGNVYRMESVMVTPSRKTSGKNVISRADGSSGEATDANGGNFYSESEVDSINIDFRAEVKGKFTSDWDLGYAFPEAGHSYQFTEGSWSATDGADKRILFNAEFNQAFKTREQKKKEKADPLWVRIESDPLKNPYTGAGVSNFNSVRQITLNFNNKNSDVEGSGDSKYYKYRPYIVFYTGPENINYATDSNGVLIRHSQPVVVNLNEDTNAILYFPNSPVVINGNEKTLTGFVIAKCFLHSVTEEDMLGNKAIELYDGFNAPKDFECGFVKGLDSEEQTAYFREDDLLTKEEIDALYDEDATVTVDGTTGNIKVTDVIDAPRQPVISFTKDYYKDCTTLADYFTLTAEYINSTYTKEKYMQFTGLSEDKVSEITFPDDKYANGKYGNFTAITIPVATADLLDTDPDPTAAPKDDKYVKVMLGEEVKYIAKAKLPYTRIKRNANYPYVCIYDLKTGFNKISESGFAGAKPTDDSITPSSNTDDVSAVVFLNSVATYKDSWAIDKDLLEKTYDAYYQAAKLTFSEEKGVKYFNINSEINNDPQVIGKYKKVVMLDAEGNVLKDKEGNEVVKYIREDDDTAYYTKVNNNKNYPENNNYIIVDKNGNMLTKPVTSPDIFGKTTVAENTALSVQAATIGNKTLSDYWNTYTREPKDDKEGDPEKPGDMGVIKNGLYRMDDNRYPDRDYRIPALERVYYKSVFNLSEESGYSYFFLDDLWRVNYTYLNVDEFEHTVNRKTRSDWDEFRDDMFFTTTRAEWID